MSYPARAPASSSFPARVRRGAECGQLTMDVRIVWQLPIPMLPKHQLLPVELGRERRLSREPIERGQRANQTGQVGRLAELVLRPRFRCRDAREQFAER